MSFAVGDRLGRFEILGLLGAGGMGEVYRARDPQLQRDVAIKVLPEALFDHADRRRRFEQEARAAGGLNHPNILSVFDVGVEGGASYIVAELLTGETLRARMGGRPLPVRKAAEFGLQIANGLAAAHDHGVVHRDIKPDNLFVTTDGRIKILDFGLAKLIGPDASGNTETVTVDGEQRTPVIGTVAYMSPEQARGRPIDHRTDVFSFGVVLYEMLAGFPPFQRATTTDTLNAILQDDPVDLPRGDSGMAVLEGTVRRCLEKKPDERFQNCRDLAFHLETRPLESGSVDPAGRQRRSRRAILATIGLVVLTAAAALGAFMATRPTSAPGPAPYRVRQMTNLVGLEEYPSISPNGDMVAFTANQDGRRQIFVRYVTTGRALPVTTDDADHELPRWLANGSALVYFSPEAPGEVQGAIYRVPTLGGSPQRVIASIGGGDVSREGRLACFRLDQERIQLVTSTLDGADVKVIAQLDTQYYRYPRWSPDNRWIAYQAGDGYRWNIYVIAARDGQAPIQLTADSTSINGLAWRPDGTGIVHASSRGTTVPYLSPLALWEVGWDGEQVPRSPRLLRQLTSAGMSYEQPDVHESGLIAATRMLMRSDVWTFPVDGAAPENTQRGQRVTRQTGHVLTPTASPVSDEVAFLSDNGGHVNVWVTTKQGPPRQVTLDDDPNVVIGVPIWSPDGKWIAYVSSKGNVGLVFGVWLIRPDGSEPRQVAPKGFGVAWSDDGHWLYYVESASSVIKRIAVAGGEPEAVESEPARNVIGAHGSTLYFVVERALMDGRPEFEIRAATLGTGAARVIKTIPAARVASWQVINPALSPDGRSLAVPLTDGATTNIWALSTEDGRWRQVTDFGDRAVFIARRVSWSHDGRSILAAIGEGDADVVLLDKLIQGIVK